MNGPTPTPTPTPTRQALLEVATNSSTSSTSSSPSPFNSPVMVATDVSESHEPSKRAKRPREEQHPPSYSRKRVEVLHERRKAVLQRYQQHSEQSESSRKLLARLKDLYKFRLLPLERRYAQDSILPEEIRDAEFDAKPMVLLLGPYSTGKTTFITHLLGGEFPGAHIGPEPTTDKFMALIHGSADGGLSSSNHATGSSVRHDSVVNDSGEGGDHRSRSDDAAEKRKLPGKTIKGNTLTVTPELPYASLASFGSAFLQHFEGSVCPSPLLRHLTMIDTPGVLSGEKQRHRSYDFRETTKWFADRSDLILLLFDAHKLDLSDEFKEVLENIRPNNDDKIRCILNKADSVNREQFVRVYGSLMWSMGKLFDSPEAVRVYTGSYWDEPLKHEDFEAMFESDEWLLIDELMNLPAVSAERKVNALVKRIRMVKVHICILGYLRQQMPRFYSHSQVRCALLKNLDQVFYAVRQKYNLSAGDMPNVDEFRQTLEQFETFAHFAVPSQAALNELDQMISEEIPTIMKHSPSFHATTINRNRGARKANVNNATNNGRYMTRDVNDYYDDEEEEPDYHRSAIQLSAAGLLKLTSIFLVIGLALWTFAPQVPIMISDYLAENGILNDGQMMPANNEGPHYQGEEL